MKTKMTRISSICAVVAVLVFGNRPAAWAAICSSSDIPCPPSGLCVVTGTWNIIDGCVLDFGVRDIQLSGTLQADSLSGGFGIRAHDLAVFGGKIRSIGDTYNPGGNIDIELSGLFHMYGTGSRLSVNGNGGGGSLSINAAAISLDAGVIDGEGGIGDNCGDAASVDLEADGGPLTMAATIQAVTGGHDCDGGEVSLTGSSVAISGTIDARGGAVASQDAIVAEATDGDLTVASSAILRADGTGQPPGDGASAGGVSLFADSGNVIIGSASITATGKSPDGQGGTFAVSAAQNVEIDAGVTLYGGGAGAGGQITIDAGGDLAITEDLIATGGGTLGGGPGGSIDVRAGGDLMVNATLNASGATGGTIFVQAAANGGLAGQIDVPGSLKARGAPGNGGTVDIQGCQVNVPGALDAGASTGGAAGRVTVFGGGISLPANCSVSAVPCADGTCVSLTSRAGGLSVSPQASIQPAPIVTISAVPSCP